MLSTLATLLFPLLLASPDPDPIEPPPGIRPPPWTLQVDPLTTALGFVHVQVERAVARHWSIYAGPHLKLFEGLMEDTADLKGYGAEVGLRYFFMGRAPEGWWAQIRGVGAHLTLDDETGFGGYVSALGGYTWIHDRWLVLAGGVGVQYLSYQLDDIGPKRVFVAMHTTVGLAF